MTANLSDQIRELIDTRARPISASEIMARPPVAARLDPVAARPKRRSRRRAAVAAGLAASAAAAITVALLGGGIDREPARHVSNVVTAAMVRQVATASGTAMAHSGHVRITYWDDSSLYPDSREAGTDEITFSGRDWNDISHMTAPPNGLAINRAVGGQYYFYLLGRDGLRYHWYRETDPLKHLARAAYPDPRKLLRFLDPAARFVRIGYQVIGGVRLEHLRATQTDHLPGLGDVPGAGTDPEVLASGSSIRVIGDVQRSLDVWVDGHGVIRQMHLTSQEDLSVPDSKRSAETGRGGRLKGPESGSLTPLRHGVERTSTWVSFLDIGQPQTITAPAHAIPIYIPRFHRRSSNG